MRHGKDVFVGNLVIDRCEHLGDLDGDHHVGAADLALLHEAWGTGKAEADLDGGVVMGDLLVMLTLWGE